MSSVAMTQRSTRSTSFRLTACAGTVKFKALRGGVVEQSKLGLDNAALWSQKEDHVSQRGFIYFYHSTSQAELAKIPKSWNLDRRLTCSIARSCNHATVSEHCMSMLTFP